MMKLAEELYQEGFISYPRTETDCFDPAYDLRVRLQACRPASCSCACRLSSFPLTSKGPQTRAFLRCASTDINSAVVMC